MDQGTLAAETRTVAGLESRPADDLVERGLSAIAAYARMQMWPEVVDAIASTALVDIQKRQQKFLASAVQARGMAELYGAAFTAQGLLPLPMKLRPASGPRRVGIVTFLICEGQAAATSLVRWVELMDRSRFEPVVISCDELTERGGEASLVGRPKETSLQAGPGLIERLKRAGAEVHVVPAEGTWLDACRGAIVRARRLKLDAAMFIASPACPVQAAMMHARVAPVQINMNIGCPLPMAGLDAIVYHNNLRANADAGTLAGLGIAQKRVETIGTDLPTCDAAVAVDRATLKVPAGAVLLMNAANKLTPRMVKAGFVDDLAGFMKAWPNVWWLGIGGGETGELEGAFARAGVLGRTRWAGSVRDPRSLIKAGDVLLNEYPEGGGNTVLEAMGCGVSVVAMHAGDRHAECIGAVLLGEHQVRPATREAYWARAAALCEHADIRRGVGAALRLRVAERFDYAARVKQYEGFIDDLLDAKTVQKPSVLMPQST